MNVVIVSNNQFFQNSVRYLLKSDPAITVVETALTINEAQAKEYQASEYIVLIDITAKESLKNMMNYRKLILYCGSKEYNDLPLFLKELQTAYFNVYTDPDMIISIIKKIFQEKQAY